MEVLIIWALLILVGYIFGKRAEKKHYASIARREKEWLKLPTTTSKFPIGIALSSIKRTDLVTGSVVVSSDYFKRTVATLRKIVGGPMQSYETLVDRARREATLRLKESCPGAAQIINLRYETSPISDGTKDTVSSIEVLAYGTAIYCNAQR
ncbi:MAG: YbjQ family protein [Burkholderiaceae bacterium]